MYILLTLVYRINAQYEINAQAGIFQKLINAQYEICAQDVNKGNKTNKVKKTAQVDFS